MTLRQPPLVTQTDTGFEAYDLKTGKRGRGATRDEAEAELRRLLAVVEVERSDGGLNIVHVHKDIRVGT